jgi:hypothetical protein
VLEEEPSSCGAVELTTGFTCISEVGHTGRHRYREAMGAAVAAATGDPKMIN